MKTERHLFIIWSKARYLEQKILSDIAEELEIIKKVEITWEITSFAENLKRFYGSKLTNPIVKMKDCGIGPFLLVLVEDHSPVYELRHTSRGTDELVNVKMFDRKQKFRGWIGKNTSKIHCTNSEIETAHDLMLLTGLHLSDDRNTINALPDGLKSNIIGADGWSSLQQLFDVLNETTEYVVLRNYEYLPDEYRSEEHGDIDLLVPNLAEIMLITKARKVYKKAYRVHCEINISNIPVRFDFRFIGDGYYHKKWEMDILKNRKYSEKGFYIPDEENYKYSLLYHALIQKPKISYEYSKKVQALFDGDEYFQQLLDFLKNNGYEITEPRDLSVYVNTIYYDRELSRERLKYLREQKTKTSIKRLLRLS